MSDVHRLPLLGHDLPETAAPQAPEKVKVFKDGGRWHSYHTACGRARGAFFWDVAYRDALTHARRCC